MRRIFYIELLLVLLLSVVFISGCINQKGSVKSGENKLTQEQFKSLLTLEDVEKVLTSQVELDTEFSDVKKMAESVDPKQVAAVDSGYAMTFHTKDEMKAITLMVMDLNSTYSAEQHFQKIKNGPEMENMETHIGDRSSEMEFNSNGIGSIFVFLKGDKIISLHTVVPDGEKPLVDLKGLEGLAKKVEGEL